LEVSIFVGRSLVALDTDHIKGYVFATDTLKEIRGASSLLDRLNRTVMQELAESKPYNGKMIYANGGSGLFLIDSAEATAFGAQIQLEYRKMTAHGASITFVVQPLPSDAPDDLESIMDFPMRNTLALLRHRLRAQKGHPPAYIDESSHPLMRLCDSCGVFYATEPDKANFFCQSCKNKQTEDESVKGYIDIWIRQPGQRKSFESPLWREVLSKLEHYNYRLSDNPKRPEDLNVFREFRGAKDYLGLIYADANGMGKKLDELSTLRDVQDFAQRIDDAVFWATCQVIADHLPARERDKDKNTWVFPFDILLIGGDDIVLVTPAAQAMEVAYGLAEQFYLFANKEQENRNPQEAQEKKKSEEAHSLSVSVILAPTNYPFSLLQTLAEDALKFAKKDGSKTDMRKKSDYGKTRVNFLVVSGSTSQSFDKVYGTLHRKDQAYQNSFYATMRPYTLEQLHFLLNMLKKGSKLALGRSKLHQLREAILQLNLSTSVTECLAVLRSWKKKQRNFVATKVYRTERKHPLYQWDDQHPAARFPIVTFPWLVDSREDGTRRYQTLLLDFVELYDFIASAGDVQDDEEEDDTDDEA